MSASCIYISDATAEGLRGVLSPRRGAPPNRYACWKLPCPVPPCDHAFKYRLVYSLNGERLVGFDNERGKGDHKHLDGKESVYRFVSIDQLLDDFIAEVERRVE